MDDIFEKKFKAFLPYIIITAVVYLFLPVLLVISGKNGGSTVFNSIVYLGVFPLTALLCNLHYSFNKENDFILALVAPILYIPSMFLYGNFRDSILNCIIFLISYFICGYLGLLIGEIISPRKKAEKESKEKAQSSRQRNVARTPKRVSKKAAEETKEHFESKNTDFFIEDSEPTTTAEDIDSILEEIHARHDSEI